MQQLFVLQENVVPRYPYPFGYSVCRQIRFSIPSLLNCKSLTSTRLLHPFHLLPTMILPTLTLLALATGSTAFTTSPTAASSHRTPTTLNAVSKKDVYQITLLPGDGIGPEIMTATKDVLAALTKRCGFQLEMKEALIGGAAIDAVNDPFPDESLQQCLSSDAVLLSCIGGYKWDGNPRELRPETGLLKMRKEMGLFANLRPAKVLDQLIDASTLKREVVEGVDVMCVRELTGDVYFGTPKGIDIVDGTCRCCAYIVCLVLLDLFECL